MTTLQTRLAQADKPTRVLLEEVLRAVHSTQTGKCPGCNWCRPFLKMLDAEAWTSAVEMLVPADVEWNCESWTNSGIYSEPVRATAWVFGAPRTYASTPALALAIACLKARGL